MIVLSWNVRGLNSGPRQKAVRDLIKLQAPDVLFLQETKLSVEGMMDLAPKLWRNGDCQCTGSQGASSGLACFWNPRKICPLWWGSFKSSLSMVASCFVSGETILFSNVYALVELQGKHILWANIRLVRSLFPYHPWIIGGDFNAITELAEKRGGTARLEASALLLQDNISALRLVDIKPGNGLFTWNNRRIGDASISERLDRFLVSSFWLGDRWKICSEILDGRGSDHWPIKLVAEMPQRCARQTFKFQLMWLRDESLHDLLPG